MGGSTARRKRSWRRGWAVLAAAAGLGVASPSCTVRAEDAAARSNAQPEGLWDKVLEGLNLRARQGPVSDFVEASRPDRARLTYLPTTAPHPARPIRAKTPAEIASIKAKLDAARAAQLNPAAPPPAQINPRLAPRVQPNARVPPPVKAGQDVPVAPAPDPPEAGN